MKNQCLHRITALKAQKNKPWRTSIFINGEYWHSCNTDTLVEIGLYENQQLDTGSLERLSNSLEEDRAFDRAVLLLSYRLRSSHEIRERLKHAGFSDNTINTTISDLIHIKYIDDAAFCRSWAENRMSLKLYGSKRIRLELKEKGISEDIIDDVLDNIESKESELDRARLSALKKLPSLKNIDKKTAFRRLGQFLTRRGYDGSIIYDICNELIISNESNGTL